MKAIIESLPCMVAKPRTWQRQAYGYKHQFKSAKMCLQLLLHFEQQAYLIAEDLIQWSTTLHKAIHSSQPQAQEAVVDTLHQHNLTDDEDRVPDVTAEVAGHH